MRDMSALSQFAEDAVVAPRDPIHRFTWPIGVDLLAFDQSLGSTGWLHVSTLTPHRLRVVDVGTLKAPAGLNLRSNLDMLLAAEYLSAAYWDILSRQPWTKIVHELPPPAGRVAGSGTSSMVSATALRSAIKWLGAEDTVMVIASQTWKKTMTGNAKAEKKEAHAALSQVDHYGAEPSNEGERDALCIAVCALTKMASVQSLRESV